VFEGDPQQRAKDRDKDAAVYVIAAALRGGRISQQDHDLRIERARSSATVGELAALVRDIENLPPASAPPAAPVATAAASPIGGPVTSPVTGPVTGPGVDPYGAPVPADPYAAGTARPDPTVLSDLYGPPADSASTRLTGNVAAGPAAAAAKAVRRGTVGCLVAVMVLVFTAIAGAVVAIVTSAGDSAEESGVESGTVPAGPAFELTAAGIREFVSAFEARFGSTEVVRAVIYDGYVVAWVPGDNGTEAIWTYRAGSFETFGDPIDANEPTDPVDLADLRPGKVMALVRTAEETLGVTDPTTTYVIYDRDIIDDLPQLSVYVSNEDGDSGYLMGDLNGKVTYSQAAG